MTMIEFNKQKKPITGEVKVFGDKEISYFSIILSSLATGKGKISGLLESKDVLNLIKIMRELGVDIIKDSEEKWVINSKGLNSFKAPTNVIDIIDSEEVLYLLVGLFSFCSFKFFFKGDDCLSNLDLSAVFDIFKSIGVCFNARNDKNLPFLMVGNKDKKQIKYQIENFNSLLKSVLLFSSITTDKENIIREKEKTRDHLEILMRYFGIPFEEHEIGNKGDLGIKVGKEVVLNGGKNFLAKDITIPSDTSFSAYISILALSIPGSDIILKGVLMNQYRDAFFRTLIDMGANISFINQKIVCGEKVCDIHVKHSKLRDTIIPANRLYKMIKEYPALMFISCLTSATIEIQGTKLLKEDDLDNYNFIIEAMENLGVSFDEEKDSLKIKGSITNFNKKIEINKNIKDPNVILALAFFGFFIDNPIKTDDSIESYFPCLGEFLNCIGLNVKEC